MKEIDNLSQNYDLEFKGKVRDIYNFENDKLLIFTSDRISAFDFTFEDQIDGKGKVLTKMAKFWFNKTKHIIENHLCENTIKLSNFLNDRCMIVKKTKVVPIEAIVRGHIAGSAWQTYKENSLVNNEKLTREYSKYDKFDEPIFTPSTKADVGGKDININLTEMKNIIGNELTDKIYKISLELYKFAYEFAKKKGVIIADTKFEFGLDDNDNLILIDEIFTPDCSRFWLYDQENQKIDFDAFDKQFFRDYLIENKWDHKQITIPENIKNEIFSKYNKANELITYEK